MIHSSQRLFTLILSLYLILTACQNEHPPATIVRTDSIPKEDLSVHGNFSDQHLLYLDSTRLDSFFIRFPDLKEYTDEVSTFYRYRHGLFAWYDQNGPTEPASNLYNQLGHLDQEGVLTPVPYKKILDSLFTDPLAVTKADPDIETLLTAEYFFYADKVWKGLSEKKTAKLQWLLPRKKLNVPYLTDSVLKEKTPSIFSADFNNRQYDLLKKQLRIYRQIDSAGKWDLLKAPSRAYKISDTAEVFSEIRHRLFLLGDLPEDSQSNHFDSLLKTAVMSFQMRNGITADGTMGASFFREINVAPQENIRKLVVNMERCRWIPTELSHHYLVINIPAFTLTAYDQDTVTFNMNVVVGKDLHQTVIFNGDIKYIVFSPYWNVPASILKNEIMPALKKDPNYLHRNNMEWNGNTVRQKPGPKNSLGLVKFLFPNSFNIYLHDSPAKSLFGADARAFSHGCIRLAEPEKMANYLLRDDPQWTSEKIHQAMHSAKEKYVTLKNPVPVYIGYLTAWVGQNGKLNFRKDIYKRDDALEDLLMNR